MSTALAETREQVEPILLFTDKNERGEVSSRAPIQWCISPATRQYLLDRDARDPQVLIVVSNNGEEMDRFVYPITKGLAYIPYRRDGQNIIHATVVWGRDPKPEKVLFDRYDNGSYKTEALTRVQPTMEKISRRTRAIKDELEYSGRFMDEPRRKGLQMQLDLLQRVEMKYWNEPTEIKLRSFDSFYRIADEAQVEVTVPKQAFGQNRPITKWLANLYRWERWWPSGRAKDQCTVRRRAYFYTVPTLPIYAPARLAAVISIVLVRATALALLVLFGMRGLSFSPLLHPLLNSTGQIWADMKPSLWWTKRVKELQIQESYDKEADKIVSEPVEATVYPMRSPAMWLFNPAVAAVLGITFGLLALFAGSDTDARVALIMGEVAGSLLAGMVMGFLGRLLLKALPGRKKKSPEEIERERLEHEEAERQRKLREDAAAIQAKARARREEEERQRAVLDRSLALVTCETGASRVASPANLKPGQRHSVTLIWDQAKVRLCKPLART